jgi:signal transduction histidine kinase
MPSRRAEEFARELPRLRAEFQTSRQLASRARERALAAAETTRAMRTLLDAYAETSREDRSRTDADVWRAAAKEIVRATKERDRMLGLLSHELRQSLSAALSAERLLARRPEEPTAQRARAVLARQLEHLSHLVEDLLDFSRVSLGTMTIAPRRIDLRAVVEDAVDAIRPAAVEHGQELVLRLPKQPMRISGDPNRLLQVFVNLLQNASRYTPPDGRIVVSCVAEEADARVTVEDTGVGIAAESLARIFEPFVRENECGGGLGIGLALAARIVALHGGQITAASAGTGRGALFTVTLPLQDPQAA